MSMGITLLPVKQRIKQEPGVLNSDSTLLGGTGNLFMPKAGHFVVVYHSDGLHESVRNGRPDKFKTFFLTFCGQSLRYRGFCRSFAVITPAVNDRFSLHDSPQKRIQ